MGRVRLPTFLLEVLAGVSVSKARPLFGHRLTGVWWWDAESVEQTRVGL